ncbi:c-type cytochrome [Sphingomonas glacialis]|uniref:Cytochrome c n=1 Tax=Sphingomonas glacialis TaxID=658225 RepID=A0A502FCM6_9SPHN|nr:cytochrome c [Sphingomonas glacialis]TPG47167.1 cytochrome c [Sphingomonas glacialis]
MLKLRTFKTVSLAAGALCATVLAGSLAAGAGPSTDAVIATRVAGFKKMGGAMKALNDQLKSGAPVKATMVAAAQTIAENARAQGKLFPAGSGPAAGVKTDALPNIWTDRATFDAQMAKLVTAADKLVAVANSGDAAAIGAQAKATGAVCGGCHRQFRSNT